MWTFLKNNATALGTVVAALTLAFMVYAYLRPHPNGICELDGFYVGEYLLEAATPDQDLKELPIIPLNDQLGPNCEIHKVLVEMVNDEDKHLKGGHIVGDTRNSGKAVYLASIKAPRDMPVAVSVEVRASR